MVGRAGPARRVQPAPRRGRPTHGREAERQHKPASHFSLARRGDVLRFVLHVGTRDAIKHFPGAGWGGRHRHHRSPEKITALTTECGGELGRSSPPSRPGDDLAACLTGAGEKHSRRNDTGNSRPNAPTSRGPGLRRGDARHPPGLQDCPIPLGRHPRHFASAAASSSRPSAISVSAAPPAASGSRSNRARPGHGARRTRGAAVRGRGGRGGASSARGGGRSGGRREARQKPGQPNRAGTPKFWPRPTPRGGSPPAPLARAAQAVHPPACAIPRR